VIGPYHRDKPVRTSFRQLPAVQYLVRRLAEELRGGRADELRGLLASDAVLVPVPRHRPNRKLEQGAWPSLSLARAVEAYGLGSRVECLLVREKAIRKSAGAKRRPDPHEHHDSFRVDRQALLQAPPTLLLVDDVITRGSTCLGAAWRLQEAFPAARVAMFAGVRTMSHGFGDEMVQPVTGSVRLVNGQLRREP